MSKLKLTEYTSYSESDRPFATYTFKYDGYSKIEFTVRKNEIAMSVEDGTPMEVVEEAIKIINSRMIELEVSI